MKQFINDKTSELPRNAGFDRKQAGGLTRKKPLFLFIFGVLILSDCFSQNMLLLGGEYNPLAPDFWNCNIGFNLGLTEYIQNDLLISLGGIKTKIQYEEKKEPEAGETQTITETGRHFLFGLKDKLYFALDGSYIGLRAGVSASLGVYSLDPPEAYRFFVYVAGFAGVCLFPKSLWSLTLDICPGYIAAFQFTDAPGAALNDSGFMLPISIGIRFNMDKL